MAIRLPLQGVLDYNDGAVGGGQTGTTSIAGGVAKTFMLPMDTDNVVLKLTASVIGGAVSATFQTTDDGGTTWFDVARTSVISYSGQSILGGGPINPEWLSIPVVSGGQGGVSNITSSVIATGSVVTFGTTIGRASASTLGSKTYSGLPILGPLNRVFLMYTAGVTGTDLARVQVLANSQSASHN
jgi:hypothetical protein